MCCSPWQRDKLLKRAIGPVLFSIPVFCITSRHWPMHSFSSLQLSILQVRHYTVKCVFWVKSLLSLHVLYIKQPSHFIFSLSGSVFCMTPSTSIGRLFVCFLIIYVDQPLIILEDYILIIYCMHIYIYLSLVLSFVFLYLFVKPA